MLQLGLVSVKLGSTEGLFKKHVSFKEVANVLPPPVIGEAHPLAEFASIDVLKLKTMFSLSCSALVGGILRMTFCDKVEFTDHGELITDKPYIQVLLMNFMLFPPVL